MKMQGDTLINSSKMHHLLEVMFQGAQLRKYSVLVVFSCFMLKFRSLMNSSLFFPSSAPFFSKCVPPTIYFLTFFLTVVKITHEICPLDKCLSV